VNTQIKHFSIIILDYLFIVVCIAPFAFAVGKFYVLLMALFVSFVCTLNGLLEKNHAINIVLGASAGFIISLIAWGIFHIKVKLWFDLEIAFLSSFCVFFLIGMAPYSFAIFFSDHSFFRSKKMKRYVLFIGLLFLVPTLLSILFKSNGVSAFLLDHPIVRGIIFGISTGALYSVFIRDWMLPSSKVFGILIDYMRAMFLPISAFFIGYFLILLAFSGIYAVLAMYDPTAFTGATMPWRLHEYIYYSVITITTVGDPDIFAHTALAKWLTMAEIMLGLMWTTVVLAAAVGYLQRTFRDLAEKLQSSKKPEDSSDRFIH